MSKRNLVIFDLDGTLIDSAPDLHAAVARMLQDLRRPALSVSQVTSFVGNGVHRLVERCLIATGGVGVDADAALDSFSRHYALAPAQLSTLQPGVSAALLRMRGCGIRLGVCTNKPQPLAEAILTHFDLMPLLSAVVGGGRTQALKPDPQPLLYCLGEARSTPDAAVYVGDSEVDEEAAQRAGLPFALFSGGYRKKATRDMRSVFVFDHFDALASWVLDPHSV